jgi:hypothetical protein
MADLTRGLARRAVNDRLPGIPRDLMPIFHEVLGEHDPDLLQSVLSSANPTLDERERVMDILADEFVRHLRPDYEPTERGKQIDDLLGKFLLQFPIER